MNLSIAKTNGNIFFPMTNFAIYEVIKRNIIYQKLDRIKFGFVSKDINFYFQTLFKSLHENLINSILIPIFLAKTFPLIFLNCLNRTLRNLRKHFHTFKSCFLVIFLKSHDIKWEKLLKLLSAIELLK